MSVIAAKLRRLIYGDFFIYRNRMKILKKDCPGKRQPSLKPVNLAGYRRRTAIWFKALKDEMAAIRSELETIAAGGNVSPYLLDLIRFMTEVMNGMKEKSV